MLAGFKETIEVRRGIGRPATLLINVFPGNRNFMELKSKRGVLRKVQRQAAAERWRPVHGLEWREVHALP